MATATQNSTGYGPLPIFSGEQEDFELWSIKFKASMRIRKLNTVLAGDPVQGVEDTEMNALLFSYLVQCLDDQSLNLIIRDASDKGREAFAILEDHYLGSSKPRIIALYSELTRLQMKSDESATDYMLRAETAAARLKNAGEQFSDKLLIAMILNGLPAEYQSFATIINNTAEDIKFTKFKSQLRNF